MRTGHAQAPPATGAGARGTKRDRSQLTARLTALGLDRPLEDPMPAWSAPPSEQERASADSLLAEYRRKAASANVDDRKLTGAVAGLEAFVAVHPNRVLWRSLDGPHKLANARHNEETFGMIAEFWRRNGSMQKGQLGKPILAGTVTGKVSTLRAAVSVAAGYDIRLPEATGNSRRAGKFMRAEDGRRSVRKLRRGVRGQHFRAAADNGFDRFSRVGTRRWARALAAHAFTMRGGELGVVDGETFQPAEGHITGASLTWFSAAQLRGIYPAVRIWIAPIKDADKVRQPVPSFVRRRGGPEVPFGADPLCAYDAIRRLWLLDFQSLPAAELAERPFFVMDDGVTAVTTTVMRATFKQVALAADMAVGEVGASSGRIGSAEDLYDRYGADGEAIIRERGRWWSDIHEVYQRSSATRQMDAVAGAIDSVGISLEELGDGWANPGRR